MIQDDAASEYSHHTASSIPEQDRADPTERTPLVSKPASIASVRTSPVQPRSTLWARRALRFISPLAIAAVAGLLVGLIPGIKRHVAEERSSFWQTFGVALGFMGMVFPVVEMLGIGAGLRAGGRNV